MFMHSSLHLTQIICGQNVGTKVVSWIIFFSKSRIIPQTTFVPTFWPHIISELGGVSLNQNARCFFCWIFYKSGICKILWSLICVSSFPPKNHKSRILPPEHAKSATYCDKEDLNFRSMKLRSSIKGLFKSY